MADVNLPNDVDTEQEFDSAENPNFDLSALEAEMNRRFNPQDENENENEELENNEAEEGSESEAEGESTEESEQEEEQEQPSNEWTAPEFFELDQTTKIPRSAIESYIAFENRLRSDPDFHKYLQSYTPAESEQVTETPKPPEDLDLDDPSIKFLWERLQAAEENNKNLISRLQSHDEVLTTQQQRSAQSFVEQATKSFQEYLSLSDDDMEKIAGVANRMGVIATYMNGVHPITGQPVTPDPLAALNTGLTMAYNSLPEFQKAKEEATITEINANNRRKKKAGAVLGASGSVSRSTPTPKTEEERQAAMIAEVAEMMNGTNV